MAASSAPNARRDEKIQKDVISMEKLASVLAEFMSRHNEGSEFSYDVYRYSFLLLLEMTAGGLTGIFMAMYMGVFVEAIIFIGVFFLLRSYAGGLHLETFLKCYLASTGILLIAFLLIKHWKAEFYLSFLLILLFGGILIVSNGCNSKNRSVSSEESVYFKKKLLWTMALTSCLYLVFAVIGYDRCSLAVSLAVTISGLLLVLGKMLLVLGKIKNEKSK